MDRPTLAGTVLLCGALLASPADAASIYRIKEDLPRGTVLTAEHLVELPMSNSSSYLIDEAQQRLLRRYVTDRRLKRYLRRALPHALPKGGYLMRDDFTLFGSIENVPLAKNPPRDFRPMIEPGFETTDDQSIAWIDNDRLLFVGFDPTDTTTARQRGHGKRTLADSILTIVRGKRHLYEWNTRTGEVTLYWRDVLGKVCVAGDWIEFRVEPSPDYPDARFLYVAGTYGQGSPIDGRELHYSDRSKPYRHGSECSRRMPDKEFVATAEPHNPSLVYPLRKGHGYLVTTRASNGEWGNLFLQRPGERARDLEMESLDVREHHTKYLPFSGRYFLEQSWRKTSDVEYTRTNCATSWWMEPNGDLEPVCIPWGPWTFVEPFRDGFVLASASIRDASDGIHLQQPDGMVQVLNAMVTELEVSPDGCRLALVTRTVKVAPDRQSSEVGPWLPKVMELCDAGTT